MQTIASSTLKFTQALSNSQARGKYGEVQLEMLLENAGLMEGIHYRSQSSSTGYGDSVLRPDIKILLPAGATIYVDSKFPFDKYLQAFDSASEQTRSELMSEHAKDLLKHVDILAKRGYHDDDASPDFVVLFAPFESILSEAIQADPQLLEKAFAKGVTIATPTTMLALLRTVGFIFGKNKMTQSAMQIQELAGELLKRITLLHSKLSTLGERIKSSERAYNDVISTAESSVMLPAKKMQALGVGPSTAVRPLVLIDDDVRIIKPQEDISQEAELQLELGAVNLVVD